MRISSIPAGRHPVRGLLRVCGFRLTSFWKASTPTHVSQATVNCTQRISFFHGLDNIPSMNPQQEFLGNPSYISLLQPLARAEWANSYSSEHCCCQWFLKEEPQPSVVIDYRKSPMLASHSIHKLKLMGMIICTWPTSFYIWGPGTSNNQVPRPLKQILESSLCPCQKNLRIKELWLLLFCFSLPGHRNSTLTRTISGALCIRVHRAHFLISTEQFVQLKFNICPHSW